jgi:drug/metabolite transporter (DMT)-like permease
VVVVALAGRKPLRVGRAALPLVLVSGVGDMTANALFLLATQQPGQLAITGVLASLYPVSTVVLAQGLLRERLVRAQVAGLGAAVTAVVLITLPG